MTNAYLGVLIEQEAGGNVTMKFSDGDYKVPQVEEGTIWKVLAALLEHYFTTHAETLEMAKDEAGNVYYLPKRVEEKKVEQDVCSDK